MKYSYADDDDDYYGDDYRHGDDYRQWVLECLIEDGAHEKNPLLWRQECLVFPFSYDEFIFLPISEEPF